MRKCFLRVVILFTLSLWPAGAGAEDQTSSSRRTFEHVILVSFDGLRPDAITSLGPGKAPAFYDLMATGTGTLNARTDYDYTETLPNHTCMLTGVGVTGEKGHGFTANMPEEERPIHKLKGRYVPSLFLNLQEKGLRSALFAAKKKFVVFPNSYLINYYEIIDRKDDPVFEAFLNKLKDSPPQFIFLHLGGPDFAGHYRGWDPTVGTPYSNQVKRMDKFLGKILKAIREDTRLRDTTAVIVTSDHGGYKNNHLDSSDPRDYTIPFFVWGEGIARGQDLYAINPESRKDPVKERIPYDASGQPIRNGDAANLILSLFGLPPVPDSTINNKQDLNVFPQ